MKRCGEPRRLTYALELILCFSRPVNCLRNGCTSLLVFGILLLSSFGSRGVGGERGSAPGVRPEEHEDMQGTSGARFFYVLVHVFCCLSCCSCPLTVVVNRLVGYATAAPIRRFVLNLLDHHTRRRAGRERVSELKLSLSRILGREQEDAGHRGFCCRESYCISAIVCPIGQVSARVLIRFPVLWASSF